MVGTTILAGGVFYVGYKAYRLLDEQARPTWWQALNTRLHSLSTRLPGRNKTMATVESRQNRPLNHKATTPAYTNSNANLVVALPAEEDQAVRQRLLLAASALGVTTASLLFYPPLRITALPVLVYLGVRPARRAQQALRQDRQLTIALVETATIALCVVQGYYLTVSLGAALYYLGQIITEKKRQPIEASSPGQPTQWAWRQEANKETVTLVSQLHAGDIILVHAGEMVPVPGVVSTGVAWVSSTRRALSADAHTATERGWVKVMTGNQVDATTIIQVGCIGITVTAAP